MPHWDFKCDTCGLTKDLTFVSYSQMNALTGKGLICLSYTACDGIMHRQIPASNFNDHTIKVIRERKMGFDIISGSVNELPGS